MAESAKTPGTKKPPKYLGATFIDQERCKGCLFCVEFCPTSALDISAEFNDKGYHFPVLNRQEDCNGCDLCGLYCPDFAIFSVRYDNPQFPGAKAAGGKEGK